MGKATNSFVYSDRSYAIATKMMNGGNKYNLFRCYSCGEWFVNGDKIETGASNRGNKRKWYHKKCKDDLYIDIPDVPMIEKLNTE